MLFSCSIMRVSLIPDADKIQPVGGGGYSAGAAVEGGEDAVHFIGRSFPSTDFDERPHDAADHVVEESVADDVEADIPPFFVGRGINGGKRIGLVPHRPAAEATDGDFEDRLNARKFIEPVAFEATELMRTVKSLS